MIDILLKSDERQKNTRCTATCLEPNCSNLIRYDADDYERPLYCPIHSSEDGRHSETKTLHPKQDAKPERKVILRCTNKKCRHEISVLESDWIRTEPTGLICPECKWLLIFHRNDK